LISSSKSCLVSSDIIVICGVNLEIGSSFGRTRVNPDSLKWDTSITVSLNIGLDIIKSLVTLGSSVPSERPEWWEVWLTNEILVLRNDLLSSSFPEEINFNVSTSGNITEDT